MSFWPFSKEETKRIGVLAGDGRFGFPIVGESHYQRELETICGGKSEEGANDKHAALLLHEPNNPYDKNAVCVKILGSIVGYLSRDVAGDFLRALETSDYEQAAAEAIITGGWHREGEGDGFFGVRLNAVMPFSFISADQYFDRVHDK